MAWEMAVGAVGRRTEIQSRYGGSHARGISAPTPVPGGVDIMLWWQPEHGGSFGYLDGWTADGTAFHFSGAGQARDQVFGPPHAENGRVLNHAENGDRVRLLRYEASNLVRYMGELRLDPDDKWRPRDSYKAANPRSIIQFRFLPVGSVLVDPTDPVYEDVVDQPVAAPLPAVPPAPRRADLEKLATSTFERVVRAQSVAAQRLELIMVYDFSRWLAQVPRHIESSGLVIPYDAERRNLRADLWLPAQRVLVEAKASTAREYIRMAIGQLFDYRRYVRPTPAICVLTPSRPPDDMLDLLDATGIGAVWQVRGGFAGTVVWLGESDPVDYAGNAAVVTS